MNYQQNIQKLEQIYNYKPEPQHNRPTRRSWLKKMWRSLVTAWSHNAEMRVWQTEDKIGRSLWKLYDPITGETFDFNSENEVRTWIEESYNRPLRRERSFRPFYSQLDLIGACGVRSYYLNLVKRLKCKQIIDWNAANNLTLQINSVAHRAADDASVILPLQGLGDRAVDFALDITIQEYRPKVLQSA